MTKQGLYFRGEGENVLGGEIVKRLNAKPVAGTKKCAALGIPKDKCKHASKAADAIGAVLLISMDDCFGIAPSFVGMPCLLKRRPQIGVIKNLAVVGEPYRARLVRHRLVSAGHINDAKPPVS